MRRTIVNDPEDLVPEALEGLVLSNPLMLDLHEEHRFITRRRPATDKVGLVSGGGSGHEPLHAGFVGTGMLDVAVAGAVFASPTALQVLEATKAADAGRGVVQIVKNYTGDVLNFRIAGEISGDDAVETEMVLVDDDLATDTGGEGGPGRRGTAATIIVEKLCGAAAEAGASLAEVAAIGRRAASRARTMSLALSAGTHPGDAAPQFTLGDDEVERGGGIHGERGRGRVAFRDADGLTELLLDPLRKELELHRG
ncbi:MAG: dihydroxyacetone kinase subunit DhaK, partial [Brachybacterium sp.]|nr:dihydroxyacetone kinase subunit DhaK [Brachybacterium sp.]